MLVLCRTLVLYAVCQTHSSVRHGFCLQVVQPDVVLASFDALASDISHLQPIEWEAIVVDERCMVQSNLVKAHQALREVESNFRLLLPSGNPTLVRARYLVFSQSHCCILMLVQQAGLSSGWAVALLPAAAHRLHTGIAHLGPCKLLCAIEEVHEGPRAYLVFLPPVRVTG